jgi:hypothetical protein
MMSIQSTQQITREEVIERLISINILALQKEYKAIEEASFEPDLQVENYIDDLAALDITHSYKWTNKMLEAKMDEPYFKHSIFDNYQII